MSSPPTPLHTPATHRSPFRGSLLNCNKTVAAHLWAMSWVAGRFCVEGRVGGTGNGGKGFATCRIPRTRAKFSKKIGGGKKKKKNKKTKKGGKEIADMNVPTPPKENGALHKIINHFHKKKETALIS